MILQYLLDAFHFVVSEEYLTSSWSSELTAAIHYRCFPLFFVFFLPSWQTRFLISNWNWEPTALIAADDLHLQGKWDGNGGTEETFFLYEAMT